jgi:signal transduction histidine kinase/CheY-like chemotaxis protein
MVNHKTSKKLINRLSAFFIASCILIVGIGVMYMAARDMVETAAEKKLQSLLETKRLAAESILNSEIALARMMSESPSIHDYFENPLDPEITEFAQRDLRYFTRNFRSSKIFWINDVEHIFNYAHNDAIISYQVYPEEPHEYWYYMTLYDTADYNININYNPALNDACIWVNVPVRDFEDDAALGLVGCGVEIKEVINRMYMNIEDGIDFHMFNSNFEVTMGKNEDTIIDKTLITKFYKGSPRLLVDIMGQLRDYFFAAAGVKEKWNLKEPPLSEKQFINFHSITFRDDHFLYCMSYIPSLGWYMLDSIELTPFLFSEGALAGVNLIPTLIIMGLFIIIAFILYFIIVQNSKLSLLEADAIAASKAKSSFLAHMSHEIRTPMNAISGISELILREEDTPAKVRDYARNINTSSANLITLINDILDISKIESGSLEIIANEYSLGALLHDIIIMFKVRLMDTPVTFAVDIDQNLPGRLRGDASRIRQILINILGNAVKYTVAGQITFRVTKAAGAQERTSQAHTIRLRFEVEDTGRGIKEEDCEKIFGEFVMVDQSKNSGIQGTGLGLAITKTLVVAMGGAITVDSVYDQGSVFHVELPQEVVDAKPLSPDDWDNSSAQPQSEASWKAPAARVLIVDDVEINLMVAEGLMSPFEMHIDTALSGASALDLVAEAASQDAPYHLIFMDHMMPDMDGIETTQKLLSQGCTTPIIALTANAISGMKETFLQAGFTDMLVKPIDVETMNEMLLKYLPADLIEKV